MLHSSGLVAGLEHRPLLSLRPVLPPQMSFAEVAANGAGAVATGYLAGAAAGPAISSIAATAKGMKNGSSLLLTPAAFATFFSLLATALALASASLGWTAVVIAPGLVKLLVGASILAILIALVPVTALITGTMGSPAIPFKDASEVDEYQTMQASYESDAWVPPRLWTGTGTGTGTGGTGLGTAGSDGSKADSQARKRGES